MTAKSLDDRLRDAAYDEKAQEIAYRRVVADIVLGKDDRRNPRERLGAIINLDDDSLVVEVITSTGKPDTAEGHGWKTVRDARCDHWTYRTVDRALLHLIAQRHDRIGAPQDAALYAARVLHIPAEADGWG